MKNVLCLAIILTSFHSLSGCKLKAVEPELITPEALLEDPSRSPASNLSYECRPYRDGEPVNLDITARGTIAEVKTYASTELNSFSYTGDWEPSYTQEHPGKIQYKFRQVGKDGTRMVADLSILRGGTAQKSGKPGAVMQMEGRSRGYWFQSYFCLLKK